MLMHTTTNKVNVDFNGKHDLGIELLTNNLGVLRNASDNNLVWILTSDQDHGENYDGKKLELVCGDTVSHRGKLSSPGNTKQQQNSKIAGARAKERATGTLKILGGHAATPELLELVAKSSNNAGVEISLKQQTTPESSKHDLPSENSTKKLSVR